MGVAAQASMAVPAIRVDGLKVIRGGATVIPDLTFEIPAGQVTGLLGPSGCGKSTLMRSLVGVQIVEGGGIRVLGEPAGSATLRHRVGYMGQDDAVYADLTARENLEYFARILGAPSADTDRVLAAVDLVEHADALVGRMSGGQVARVSLAAALLGSPELLILDEPTVGLDPIQVREIRALIAELTSAKQAERAHTVVLSTHILAEVEAICRRVILIHAGRKVVDSPLAELTQGGERLEDLFARVTTADQAAVPREGER